MKPDELPDNIKKLNPTLLTPRKAEAKQPRKKATQHEHEQQKAFIKWCDVMSQNYPELKLIYSNPAGGFRHKKTAGMMKAEGQRAGIPDLTLPVARRGFHGFYLEMKTEKGHLSDHQENWCQSLILEGYCVFVAHSLNEAIGYMSEYLGITEDNEKKGHSGK